MSRKSTWCRSASFAAISTLPVILGCTLFGTTGARATPYIATIQDANAPSCGAAFFSNCVIVAGSGNIDTTGLTMAPRTPGLFSSIQPSLSGVVLGGQSGILNVPGQTWTGIPSISMSNGSNTSSFLAGFNNNSSAMGGSGLGAGITGNLASIPGRDNELYTPLNYVNDSFIPNITSIYVANNATSLAALGLIPGEYTWRWGNGADQTFTVCVGDVTCAAPSAIPLPATLPLLGTGLGALGLLGWRRKRRAVAVA